jgi:hypothetical protein
MYAFWPMVFTRQRRIVDSYRAEEAAMTINTVVPAQSGDPALTALAGTKSRHV